MAPPIDENPTFGNEKNVPIYHIARDMATRSLEEPGTRVGDTEWAICHKHGITYDRFRSLNGLPSRERQPNLTIQVGRKYLVGYKKMPVIIWSTDTNTSGNVTPTPRPQPVVPPKPVPAPPPPVPVDQRKLPTQMKASQPLIDYMKSWERPPIRNGRISGQVFRDTKGSMTIGYGHWIKEEERSRWAAFDPEMGGTREMTLSEMEQLFREDVQRLAEIEVHKRFKNKLRQGEYDALVDLAFHRGGGSLRDSGLESYMNSISSGQYDTGQIKDAFMKYAFWFNRTTGQWEFVAGFEKRRKEELNMFLFGQYTLHQ
ncbi:MAG: LysM peptidoglycan-binding domain-containing protein [Saprospiraceae bacterium]|nr:LysM peptidoglycan-binding domain-containing protein [Saprospiraceae bacterium]